MKQILKLGFNLLLLLSLSSKSQTNIINNTGELNTNSQVHTYINYRSQGANTARELVGWQTEIYRPTYDFYWVTTLTFEYQRSFRNSNIAKDWFGASCLKFQGSEVEDRSTSALVANYFGLNPDFNEKLCFDPKIENFIFDWNVFFGLDPIITGLYFRAHFPFVHAKWTLFSKGNDCFINNCTSQTNTANLDQCFISDTTNPGVNSIRQALNPGTPQVGQFFGANKFGGICPNALVENKLADVDLILGLLILNGCCGHLGFYLQYVAPTGTNYNCSYNTVRPYFWPQIGNGHHNELGAGITSHLMLYDNGFNSSCAVYLEGNVTHMFSNKQCRLFDLCSGAYTRYMLLREFESDGTTPTGNLIMANNSSFNNRLVDIKIDAKVDFSLKVVYIYCNWALDLGYNIYYHSKEKLDNACKACLVNNNNNNLSNFKYGVAGLTGNCCFNYDLFKPTPEACYVETPRIGNSGIVATVPNANSFEPNTGMVPEANVDTSGSSICLAYNSTLPEEILPPSTIVCSELTAENGFRPIQGDLNTPTILKNSDLNLNSGLSPAYLTNKFFFHLNYMWCLCEFDSFIGIGGEVEFAPNNNTNCFSYCKATNFTKLNCNKNYKVGLNQWGIWIKAGLSF